MAGQAAETFVKLSMNYGPVETAVAKASKALNSLRHAVKTNVLSQADYQKILGTGVDIFKNKSADHSHIASLKSGLTGLKTIIAGIAASTVVAGASWALKLGSDLQSAQVQFGVLLQSEEKARGMLAELKEFANVSPFSQTEVRDAAKQLIAYGVAGADVLPLMRQLGDVSLGDKDKMQHLALAFSQCSAAGRLMGQDLLQMVNSGFQPLEYISKRTGEDMISLKARMEAGAISVDEVRQALTDATSAGGRFFGATEKASKTTAGLWSSAMDIIESSVANFGTMLTQAFDVDNILTSFNEKFMGVSDVIARCGPIAQDLKLKFLEVMHDMQAVIEPFIGSMGGISGTIGTIADGFAIVGKVGYAAFYLIKAWATGLIVALAQISNGIVWLTTALGQKGDYTFGQSLMEAAAKMRKEVNQGMSEVFSTQNLPGQKIAQQLDQIASKTVELTKVQQDQRDATVSRNKALEDDTAKIIATLQGEIETFGMSEHALQVYKLAQRGLSSETQNQIKGLQDQLHHLKELEKAQKKAAESAAATKKKMQDDAKHVIESIRTPFEVAADEFKKLRKLYAAKLLTDEQFVKASKAIKQEGKGEHRTRFAGEALSIGGQDARLAILQHNNPNTSKTNYEKQAVDIAKQQRDATLRIEQLMSRPKPPEDLEPTNGVF